MSVLVLSYAYTDDPSKYRGLEVTSWKHGVPLHIEGTGMDFDYEGGPLRVAGYLEKRPETHVVLTDAFDVLVNTWDEKKLCGIIDSAPNVIVSVEANCYPDKQPWKKVYDNLPGPWKYINAGQFCGRRLELIAMLKEQDRRWKKGEHFPGWAAPQDIMHRMYAEGYPLSLDLGCSIFQSMYGPEVAHINTIVNKVAYNSVRKTSPMFLHFNGKISMEPWYSLLTQE